GEIPSQPILGELTVVRPTPRRALAQRACADEAVCSQSLIVAAEVENRRVERPRADQTVEFAAALLDEVVAVVEPVAGRATRILDSLVRYRKGVLHCQRIEHAPLKEVVIRLTRYPFDHGAE